MTLITELPTATFGDFAVTAAERAALMRLAVAAVARHAGVALLAAQVAVDQATARGAVRLVADGDTVAVEIDGEQVAAGRRDWLRRAAAEERGHGRPA